MKDLKQKGTKSKRSEESNQLKVAVERVSTKARVRFWGRIDAGWLPENAVAVHNWRR